jgi:hypothetical protein
VDVICLFTFSNTTFAQRKLAGRKRQYVVNCQFCSFLWISHLLLVFSCRSSVGVMQRSVRKQISFEGKPRSLNAAMRKSAVPAKLSRGRSRIRRIARGGRRRRTRVECYARRRRKLARRLKRDPDLRANVWSRYGGSLESL